MQGSASDNSGVKNVEVKVNSDSWKQASGTTSWSTSVSLSEGANTITAKATDICGNEQSTSITVHYKPSPPSIPDFTISVSPSSRTISPGESATYTVSLTAVEGFSSPVSLSVSGQPSGATAGFDSTSVTPTGSTTLTIDTPTTTSEGAYTVTVTGTGGGKTHQAKAKLVISSEALPDLVITDIWWEPEDPKPGEGVTFYHTVSNVGNADASDFGDALDIDGEGWDITARGSLAAGKSKERFSTHLWKAEAGHHIIKVEADWEDCISESDKTNNVLIKELIVEEPLPDLVITDIWWEPENPKHGDEVTFYHTVTNQGNADASDFGDALDIDGEGWDITARSSLAAGKSVERFSTHVWIASTGTHTIKVEADWEDCISESDKTNNVLTKELVISTIELIPSSHDFGEVPYLCSRGFSFTLKNAGSETATGTVCLTGDDADQFRIDSESDDFSLIAGEAMAIDVVFYPTSTGTKSAILRANDCQSTLMGMGVGYDWTEESHAWVKCIPWEVEDISEYMDEALNHLVSAGISEWIRYALKLSAKGGLPISVAVGVYMQMGLAGYPAEIENTFIERGEEVEMDNMQVNHRYLAWFMVDPGDEQFVIGTATLQSYWRYEWIDVGTYEVLSQEEASKYNCNTFIWIVPKEPFVFSEKGRYRFLFTTPWGFSRSGNNGFEVVADSWSPFLEDYKVSNDPSTHIYLKFSEDVEKSTVDGSTITVVGSASGVHSCSFKFDNPNYDVELIPTDRFSNGETVEVTIGAGVTDLCGNAFTTPNNFVFTIG